MEEKKILKTARPAPVAIYCSKCPKKNQLGPGNHVELINFTNFACVMIKNYSNLREMLNRNMFGDCKAFFIERI